MNGQTDPEKRIAMTERISNLPDRHRLYDRLKRFHFRNSNDPAMTRLSTGEPKGAGIVQTETQPAVRTPNHVVRLKRRTEVERDSQSRDSKASGKRWRLADYNQSLSSVF